MGSSNYGLRFQPFALSPYLPIKFVVEHSLKISASDGLFNIAIHEFRPGA